MWGRASAFPHLKGTDMINLESVAGTHVPAGTALYGLTADQVRRRAHQLDVTVTDDGDPVLAVAKVRVFFKAGESVGFDEAAVATLARADWADERGHTLADLAVAAKAAAREEEKEAKKADKAKKAPAKKADKADEA